MTNPASRRESNHVAHCMVARLMRRVGRWGIIRGKVVRAAISAATGMVSARPGKLQGPGTSIRLPYRCGISRALR